LTHADLIGVVRDLIGESDADAGGRPRNSMGRWRSFGSSIRLVKDELARLKHLPPRPPIKPSGMDKSTQAKGPEAGDREGRALIAPARQPTRQTGRLAQSLL